MTRPSSRRSPTAGNWGQGSKWIRPTTRHAIYQRDGWRCVWCRCVVDTPRGDSGAPADEVAGAACLDHIVTRARGGGNAPANLLTACLDCNEARGDRSALEFATSLVNEFRDPTTRSLERAAILERVLVSMGTPIVRQARRERGTK